MRRRRALPPNVVEDVARATGQVRLYYRAPRTKPLPGEEPRKVTKIRIYPGVHQEGFWEAYEAAKQGIQLDKPAAKTAPRVREKTFAALCRDYARSAPFHQLRPISQRTRKGILKHCCEEETKAGSGLFMGDVPVAEFATKHVIALRDRKAKLPEAANNRVKAIRAVFAWHQEGTEGARNPCAGLKKMKSANAEGFHSWTMEEVAAFEATHTVGTNARLAFDLALYTAQRKSDVVLLGPKHVVITDEVAWLCFNQQKTGARVEIPIIEPLATSIAARMNKEGSAFLMTSYGKPFTANGIGGAFRSWCDEADLPDCAMHGLRKATASRLAELGVDEHGIGSVTGHEPGSKEMARYTKAARRRLMAAATMKKLQDSLPSRTSLALKKSHPENAIPKNGTFSEEKSRAL